MTQPTTLGYSALSGSVYVLLRNGQKRPVPEGELVAVIAGYLNDHHLKVGDVSYGALPTGASGDHPAEPERPEPTTADRLLAFVAGIRDDVAADRAGAAGVQPEPERRPYCALCAGHGAEEHDHDCPEGGPMSSYDGIEITYSIRQIRDGDPVEVGFGSSGEWDGVDAALHALSSDVERRQWETSGGMPDPSWAEGDR